MNSMAEAPQPSISDRALAEAAGWMVRLHGPERTEVVESGWRDWFRAHPDHASAWEVVSDTWTKSHAIPVGLVHPPVRVRRRNVIRRRLFAIAVISAAAMMVVATILFSGRNVVTTVIGEQRTLNLQDGTRIELNTSTRLIVRYDKSTRLVELKSGEAYFSVAHEYRPFVVIAGDRKVIAVGTSFTVRREKSADAMTVTLIEGRVAVAPTSAPDVLPKQSLNDITVLNAGERIRIRPHAAAAVDGVGPHNSGKGGEGQTPARCGRIPGTRQGAQARIDRIVFPRGQLEMRGAAASRSAQRSLPSR